MTPLCVISHCSLHTLPHAQLWIQSSGQVPTYSWVVNKMKNLWDADVGGNSLHSGGATALALAEMADDHIQACSHWSLNAYQIYIRKHLIMLQSLLHGHSEFNTNTWDQFNSFFLTSIPSQHHSLYLVFTVTGLTYTLIQHLSTCPHYFCTLLG